MTDAILWWTGAIVWGLIGGSIIAALMVVVAICCGFIVKRMAENMLKDAGSLNDVRLWIAQGRPNRDIKPHLRGEK